MANVSEFLFEHETVGEAAAGNNNNDNHAQPLPECCSGAETDADNADDRIYDEDDEKFLSEDTYSFMPASPTWSASFGLSLGVVTLRLVAYALIGANILNPSDHHNPSAASQQCRCGRASHANYGHNCSGHYPT